MPKETIHANYSPGDNAPFEVQVGWLADCDVQIGVAGVEGHSLLTQLYGDKETMVKIGKTLAHQFNLICPPDMPSDHTVQDQRMHDLTRQVFDIIDSEGFTPDTRNGYSSVWVSLSRPGINRLISVLRRARNSAFGADE